MTLLFLLKISLAIFIAGNLLEMGLRLNLRDALEGLRNVRFVAYTLLWGFILGPGLAYAITLIIPLEPPYALGLILFGMALTRAAVKQAASLCQSSWDVE